MLLCSVWEDHGPSFGEHKSPSPKDACTKFGLNWPIDSGKSKMWKVFRWADRQQTTGDQKSSGELKLCNQLENYRW